MNGEPSWYRVIVEESDGRIWGTFHQKAVSGEDAMRLLAQSIRDDLPDGCSMSAIPVVGYERSS